MSKLQATPFPGSAGKWRSLHRSTIFRRGG
jgi:hypothetical protein